MLADIEQRIAQNSGDNSAMDAGSNDKSYMIIFGGKNAETDVLFNDIYFLGIP